MSKSEEVKSIEEYIKAQGYLLTDVYTLTTVQDSILLEIGKQKGGFLEIDIEHGTVLSKETAKALAEDLQSITMEEENLKK